MNVASPDYSDGCMIALYPPPEVAATLTVDGGLPAADMHVTVCYLGDAADIDGDLLREVVAELAERQPFTAQLAGHARFTGGDKDVIVALVDSADLEDLRRDTLDALYERGIQPPRDHGYTAHLTITYLDASDEAPLSRLEAQPASFTTLAAVHGTDRTDYPLEHPMAAPAREAFAAGWALSGGPMTERVKAASVAAVQTAIEHAGDPHILEATINLGKLEGTWATLFARRERLIAQYTGTATSAWRDLITPRTFRDGLYHFRAELGLAESSSDDERRRRKEAATAAALAMLQALTGRPGWAKLRQAIRDALAAGRAEGIVNSVALAAERAGRTGLDWDKAFARAYQQLERLDELWSGVDDWADRIIHRAAADLANALADQADEGASHDEMTDAAVDTLGGAAVAAVGFVLDWAMTAAADRGALDLYQRLGTATVNWVTVGDERVCPRCEANEAGNPWPLDSVPEFPAHPRCRCMPVADIDLGRFTDWFTT